MSSNTKKKYKKKENSLSIEIEEENIFLLWLTEVAPPRPHSGIELNLENMSLIGDPEKCQQYYKKVRETIKRHCIKIFLNIPKAHFSEIRSEFKWSFDESQIDNVMKYLVKEYKLFKLKSYLKEHFFCQADPVLLVVQRQNAKSVEKLFQKLSKKKIQENQEKQKKKYKKKKENNQQDDQNDEEIGGFYSMMSQKQNQDQEEKIGGFYSMLNSGTDKSKEEKEEKELKVKKYSFECEYPENILSPNEFRKWLKENERTFNNMKEFDLAEKNGGNLFIGFAPIRKEKVQRKLQALNRFFKYQQVLRPQFKVSEEGFQKIEKTFCSEQKNYLSCKIIKGYWDPKIKESFLRKLINEDKIRKTQNFNKEYRCIWIEGLEKIVKEKYKEIKSFIEDLPRQNIKEQLIVELEKLKDYMHQDKVKQLIYEVCKQLVQKYKILIFVEVSVKFSAVILNFEVKYDQIDQYKEGIKERLKEDIKQNFEIEQIKNSDQIPLKLQEEFIIFPSEKSENKVLIDRRDKIHKSTIKIMGGIMAGRTIDKKSISFPSIFLPSIKELQSKEFQDYQKMVKFTYQSENNKSSMTFVCANILGEKILAQVEKKVAELEDNILLKEVNLEEEEFNVVCENQQKIKKCLQSKYKFSFDIAKNVNKGSLITLGMQRTLDPFGMPIVMLIKRTNRFSQLPPGTIILFRNLHDVEFSKQGFLNPLKIAVKSPTYHHGEIKDDSRKFLLVYSQNFSKIENFFEQYVSNFDFQLPNKKKRFAFVMPKHDKKKFIVSLLQAAESTSLTQNVKIQLFVFDNSGENLENTLALQKGYTIKKWFVSDGGDDFFYSEEGNRKIKRAEDRGESKVILYNQDLNLNKKTHRLSYKNQKLVHWQNKVETSINFVVDGYAYVQLRNNNYRISKSVVETWRIESDNWKNQIQVSLGIYEIDLKAKTQTNLFSDFSRVLRFKQFQYQRFLKMSLFSNYNYEKNQLNLHYEKYQANLLAKAEAFIKDQISNLRLQQKININIGNYDDDKISFMASNAAENKVQMKYDQANSQIILGGFDKSSIVTFSKMIPLFEKIQTSVQYPQTWEEQKEQIETFKVDPKSDEFKEVQKAFTVAKIEELLRIQNRPIYKKYYQEKLFLKNLNGEKNVKEMKLYHGTRTTDPKILYEDKEECFNINYTGDNNFLGRGTYFAEKSEYSHNYSYRERNVSMFNRLFTQKVFSEMFFCIVLVGDSQNIQNVTSASQSMRDTEFKDTKNKIRYESSTMFTNNSQIYTVYKNRRAYPLYLIKY